MNDSTENKSSFVRINNGAAEYIDLGFCVLALAFIPLILLGNALVIVSVCRLRRLSLSVTRLCIINLACADSFNIVAIATSFTEAVYRIVEIIEEQIALDETLCKLHIFMVGFPKISSLFSMVIIAIDRYLKVAKWQSYDKLMSVKRVQLAIGISWLIALSLSGVGGVLASRGDPHEVCSLPRSTPAWYHQSVGVCVIGMPVASGCIMYILIVKATRDHAKHLQSIFLRQRSNRIQPVSFEVQGVTDDKKPTKCERGTIRVRFSKAKRNHRDMYMSNNEVPEPPSISSDSRTPIKGRKGMMPFQLPDDVAESSVTISYAKHDVTVKTLTPHTDPKEPVSSLGLGTTEISNGVDDEYQFLHQSSRVLW